MVIGVLRAIGLMGPRKPGPCHGADSRAGGPEQAEAVFMGPEGPDLWPIGHGRAVFPDPMRSLIRSGVCPRLESPETPVGGPRDLWKIRPVCRPHDYQALGEAPQPSGLALILDRGAKVYIMEIGALTFVELLRGESTDLMRMGRYLVAAADELKRNEKTDG